MVLLTASSVLFFLAMFAGDLALPLHVTQGPGRPDEVVGTLFAMCAVVKFVATLRCLPCPGKPRVRIYWGG